MGPSELGVQLESSQLRFSGPIQGGIGFIARVSDEETARVGQPELSPGKGRGGV